MQTKITKIPREQSELVGERQYQIAVGEICYIESVDNKSFLYTKNKVYESRQKLYELEELLREKHFLRVSKSMLLNLMKVGSIQPARGSRFIAVLRTGPARKS